MSRILFIIASTHHLPQHGLLLLPGIAPVGEEQFSVGTPIVLKKPDGRSIQTSIAGLEIGTRNGFKEIPVMLKGFLPEQVPIGTEVWSSLANRHPSKSIAAT